MELFQGFPIVELFNCGTFCGTFCGLRSLASSVLTPASAPRWRLRLEQVSRAIPGRLDAKLRAGRLDAKVRGEKVPGREGKRGGGRGEGGFTLNKNLKKKLRVAFWLECYLGGPGGTPRRTGETPGAGAVGVSFL